MLCDPRDCNPLCDGVMCLHHEISWYQKKKKGSFDVVVDHAISFNLHIKQVGSDLCNISKIRKILFKSDDEKLVH